ncbi:MAG: tRNA preQ1(34) S-adenosylmethionine ribosyltransferase-isomerase QueA [Phycisphaerales bacterium]
MSDLEYELPPEAVATHPAVPRESARLLVARRGEPAAGIEDRRVSDLPDLLAPGDLLVVNTTRVIPARFVGVRADTGGRAEGLYLADVPGEGSLHWRAMLKARRLKEGVRITLESVADGTSAPPDPEVDGTSGVSLELLSRSEVAGEEGAWVARVHGAAAGESSMALLARVGLPPIPPYIRAARRQHEEAETCGEDPAAYQTVYARADRAGGGSVAAPTAGLHFSPKLLARLEARGVRRAEVALHVGTGTFKVVETEFLEQHPMHAEWCCVPEATRRLLVDTRAAGGRVIAVGTTTARTLESFPDLLERPGEREVWTRILIAPGHEWRNVDGLMTNFHLPRSTLMAMVGAFLGEPGGIVRLIALYQHAIAQGYRFYSYGDAMLVV